MIIRTMIILAAPLILACGEGDTLIRDNYGAMKESQIMVLPYEGQQSLEERILSGEIIARVELASHRIVGARYINRAGTLLDLYSPAIEFTFNVLEYLKGTGGTTLTALAYGYHEDADTLHDTAKEAKANSWMLELHRDGRWDDRQAIVFLVRPVPDGPYLIGRIGTRTDFWDTEVLNTVTVSDDERQAWLPDAVQPGSTKSPGAGGTAPGQRFLLEDPDEVSSGVTRQGVAGTSTVPTITKISLRTRIADVEGGITSDAYRECVIAKHRSERIGREYVRRTGTHSITQTRDLTSGLPADTKVTNPWGHIEGYESYIIRTEWLIGRDKDLLTLRGGYLYTNRPLPQGEYEIFWNFTIGGTVDCPPYSKESLERHRMLVTVTAPAGTLAESFFDPYADGVAVTGTTTVGTVSWQPPSAGSGQAGRVTADLDIDATGHALDFIGLDGTTTLSLIVADATESAGTLTWAVPSQPWRAGDKLMLRIRRYNAPAPTPTSAP